MSMKQVFEYIDSNQQIAVDLLARLVRQPSVAATGDGIEECAELVRSTLDYLGANPEIYTVGKASPLVAGEIKSKKNPKKTILFYNHYDVQPPEPLELWESPPYEPTIREGKMFGRGTSDDKGELAGRIELVEAFLKVLGDVPCNIKFLIEGEEEIGSAHLSEYSKSHPDLFKSDGVIWEFGGVDAGNRPHVTLGVKGMLYVQLNAKNASRDVHSSMGAIVENPAWHLVSALNTLKKGEKISIAGWYSDMKGFTKEELNWIRKDYYEAAAIKKALGIRRFVGNMTSEEAKRALAGEPTCTICGLYSGYTGVGTKTVLPSVASAKIDFRLVPEQDPVDLFKKLQKHLLSKGFGDIEVISLESEKAKRTSPSEPLAIAAKLAAKDIFRKEAKIEVSSPATGPMFVFKAPCVAIGGGHAFSNNHAPNENKVLENLGLGMKWVAATVDRFARL
jgi:acetylornithine deacetylase/succinyl-diaminopimelate desuccinylase-like protein